MAIKMRRGNFSDLDTSKLVGGEIAVTDNPSRVVVKTNAGDVIKLVTENSVASDAFANIKVGNTTIEAIGDDTLEFEAGTGVTITPDATNKKVTMSVDTTNLVAKSSTSGLLKNDGTVDTTSYVPAVSGKGLSTNDFTDADKTALETTIPLNISQLQASLLTKADASDVPSALSDLTDDSTHRVVTDTEKFTWNGKQDAVSGKGLSTNDYTDADKTALQTTIPLEISQLQGSLLTKVNRSEIYSQPTWTVSGETLIYTPGALPS